MTPEALDGAIAAEQSRGVHGPQRGPVSITNVTERGTVYTVDEIAALAGVARGYGLPVHLDGARFANALVALGCTPAEMTWKAGVDAVSFGGTKNGLLGVEAVIFFDPAHAWEFELRRKRGAHLFSKHRYLSAQMLAYLTDDLWLDCARRANAAAARLAAGLAGVPGAAFLHAVEANMIFATLPRATHDRLFAAGAEYYLWNSTLEGAAPDAALAARLVCDWSLGTRRSSNSSTSRGAEPAAASARGNVVKEGADLRRDIPGMGDRRHVARPGDGGAVRIGDAARKPVVDRGDVARRLGPLDQQHRHRDPPQRTHQPRAIVVDRRGAGLDQVDALHDRGALRLGQAVPAAAIAPAGGEGARGGRRVAAFDRRAVGGHVGIVRLGPIGMVGKRDGEEDRLDQHQAAHQVGPFHRQPQRHGGAEGMADHIHRPRPAQQVGGDVGAQALYFAAPSQSALRPWPGRS